MLDEVVARLEVGGDRQRARVAHHRDRRPLLSQQQQLGLVVGLAPPPRRRRRRPRAGSARPGAGSRRAADRSRAAAASISSQSTGALACAIRYCSTRCFSVSSRNRARSARSMRVAIGPGVPRRVSTARASSSAPVVGLDARQHPLGAGVEPVEIEVHRHRVDRPGGADHLGRHHLGTGPVLGLGREHEARVAHVVGVALVVVVIDPGRQAAAQPAG